jgi:hypothetical protein
MESACGEIMGFQWRVYVRRSWDFIGERMCGDNGISVESVCEEIMGFQWRAYVRRSWDFNGKRVRK